MALVIINTIFSMNKMLITTQSLKGEEIVFKEIGKPRPVGGVIHLGWQRPSLDIELFKDVPLYNVQRPLLQRSLHLNMEEGL